MNYNDLFKNGSLRPISNLVTKIVRDGLGGDVSHELVQQLILLISTLIVVFLLYKLAWLVLKAMKFIINCLEW